MTELLILGAGGHAKVVAETALAMGSFSTIAFLDDHAFQHSDQPSLLGWPILGPLCLSAEPDIFQSFKAAIVGIGDAEIRL